MYYGWPDIIEKIEKGQMFIIGKGDKLLQLTYVTDAAEGIVMSISHDKCINQIFNICGAEAYKLKDIFYTIAGQLNRPYPKNIPFLPIYLLALLLEKIPYNLKLGTLKYLDLHRLSFFNCHHVYNIAKAKNNFGYTPKVKLSSGMQDTIRWYFEHKKRGFQDE
jgi:nucleoside-diphosphate-sugar epimerase